MNHNDYEIVTSCDKRRSADLCFTARVRGGLEHKSE